jgi:hypothetical protein
MYVQKLWLGNYRPKIVAAAECFYPKIGVNKSVGENPKLPQ